MSLAFLQVEVVPLVAFRLGAVCFPFRDNPATQVAEQPDASYSYVGQIGEQRFPWCAHFRRTLAVKPRDGTARCEVAYVCHIKLPSLAQPYYTK